MGIIIIAKLPIPSSQKYPTKKHPSYFLLLPSSSSGWTASTTTAPVPTAALAGLPKRGGATRALGISKAGGNTTTWFDPGGPIGKAR